MTFVNPFLLYGAALVAVPIVLHLVMRRKPQHIEFPAIQFVQQRHEANRRRIRLRHLVLLALRIATIALLALALARPSAKFSGSLGSQEAPVAAAFVFDAAPRMEYRQANETRLEAAQKLAAWLLRQLPPESRLAVLDTRLGPIAFQIDRAAAAQRIDQLIPVANSQPLPVVLDEALRLLATSDLARKEVYVFTDLARAAWPADAVARLQSRAAQLPDVSLCLVDVGIDHPTDFALGELRLSAETLSSRGTLRIRSTLARIGPADSREVELSLLDKRGQPQRRGQRLVRLDADAAASFDFQITGLAEGTHQGFVRIVGQDSLAADDVRYFSVEVKPPWPLLLVDPRSPHAHVGFLSQMLAPTNWPEGDLARFTCDTVAQGDLAQTNLDRYAAVCLVDPKPLAPADWDKLAQYVSAGGGLAVFLGRNARPLDSFNAVDAQRLLPGPLVRQSLAPGEVHLAPRDFAHPILAPLRDYADSIPWSDVPVYRYWQFGKLAEGTGVVVPLSDGRPAFLQRTVGDGRVIVVATPISDLARGEPWNLLPLADPSWPTVALVNQTMLYLVGATDERLNYFAGQPAAVATAGARFPAYVITTPGAATFSLSVDPRQKRITITSTDEPGNYRVRAGGSAKGVDLGFSVNLASKQTDLDRLEPKELAELLRPVPYRIARNRAEIERTVSMARVGRELFPLLVLLVAVALATEHVLANRFYRE